MADQTHGRDPNLHHRFRDRFLHRTSLEGLQVDFLVGQLSPTQLVPRKLKLPDKNRRVQLAKMKQARLQTSQEQVRFPNTEEASRQSKRVANHASGRNAALRCKMEAQNRPVQPKTLELRQNRQASSQRAQK